MRSGKVYINKILAGAITEIPSGYRFEYEPDYVISEHPSISLTLPKNQGVFESPTLFSFFFGLLSEGGLKDAQCRALKLDENDHFGRLLKTCGNDTIGCVTVVEVLR